MNKYFKVVLDMLLTEINVLCNDETLTNKDREYKYGLHIAAVMAANEDIFTDKEIDNFYYPEENSLLYLQMKRFIKPLHVDEK